MFVSIHLKTPFCPRKEKILPLLIIVHNLLMEPTFSEMFPGADKSAWLAQIQKEQKNNRADVAAPEESALDGLRWHTDEGFVVDPYYTANDLDNLPLDTIQAAQKQSPGWLNAPAFTTSSATRTDNELIRDSLHKGADAMIITLSRQVDWFSETGPLTRLLHGIKLSETPLFFRTGQPQQLADMLGRIIPYSLKGGICTALPANSSTLTDYYQSIASVTGSTLDATSFKTVCVNSESFHNAGANAVQELAFALNLLADQYDFLTDAGLSIDQLIPKTLLSVSIGTSYFVEIAKLRALRVLLNRFLSAYNVANLSANSFTIHCQTSVFYDSTATPYTNLLRSTTEAMAAVIGGCDLLTVHPYNTILGQPQEHENRLARNVSILLNDESFLGKVADPSAGSYYIENLTHQLIESAWTMFLDVEQQGGFSQAYSTGFVERELERAYQKKVDAIRSGNVLVGVTKFRFDEPIPENVNPDVGNLSSESFLPLRRLASEFE